MPEGLLCCLGVLSPELLPVDVALFISGLGTFLANSKAFSRTDLLFGVSALGLEAAVAMDACSYNECPVLTYTMCT